MSIALLDLDGTVADYNGSILRHMKALAAPGEEESEFWSDAPHMVARRDMIKRLPGFWRNLGILTLGFDVVDMLRDIGYSINVLTKGPSSKSSAWAEKVDWCREHLPDASITITEDKSLTYGRVLVDDFPDYFLPWLKFRPRGLVIAVAHPWNIATSHPNVIRYDGTNAAQVREALERAYSR